MQDSTSNILTVSTAGAAWETPLLPRLPIRRHVYSDRARALSRGGRPAWRPARCGLPRRQAGRHSGRPLRPGDAVYSRALLRRRLPLTIRFRCRTMETDSVRRSSHGAASFVVASGSGDRVNPTTGSVGHRFLVLDQSMIMAALDNALENRALQRHFAADPASWATRLYLSYETMSIH